MPAPPNNYIVVNTSTSIKYGYCITNGSTVFGIDNNFYSSTDSGVTWNTGTVTGYNDTYFLDFACNSTGTSVYAIYLPSGLNVTVVKSTNGGVTFSPFLSASGLPADQYGFIGCDGTGTTVVAVQRHGFGVTSSQNVYYSNNSGNSWTQSTMGLGGNLTETSPVFDYIAPPAVSRTNGTYIYLVGQSSGIGYYSLYRSGDSGGTFNEQFTNFNTTANNWLQNVTHIVCDTTGSILYAAAGQDGVYVSQDSGASWSSTNIPIGSYKYVSCDSTGTIVISADIGSDTVYVSQNSGSVWVQQTVTGVNSVKDVIISPDSSKSYIFSSGNTSVYHSAAIAKIPCFKEDTKILCKINGVETYMPIKDLTTGVLIKTAKHGFKPINMIGKQEISHIASKERIGDQLYVCTKEKYPELIEDLIITGGHAILVNNFKDNEEKQKVIQAYGELFITDDKYRLPASIDHKTKVYEIPGKYTVYHIYILSTTNNNYGIYANGLLVESCFKKHLINMMSVV